MKEIWKDIESHKGSYQVSSLGRVKSLDKTIIRSNGKPLPIKGRVLKQTEDSCGYLQVTLPRKKNHKVHRLLAQAFIPNPENKATINHINGNKQDNSLSNLEWVSKKENTKHAKENGLTTSGHNFTRNDVIDIRRASSLGVPRKDLAEAYNVTHRCISRLLNYETYANI